MVKAGFSSGLTLQTLILPSPQLWRSWTYIPMHNTYSIIEKRVPAMSKAIQQMMNKVVWFVTVPVLKEFTNLWYTNPQQISHIKSVCNGLAWWLRGKEPTCQGRRHRFNPWSRKTPRDVEKLTCGPQQLSLCVPEPVLREKKPLQWGAQELQLKRSPHSLQLERSLRPNEDPAQPKINFFLKWM